jgi:hypothetical protein
MRRWLVIALALGACRQQAAAPASTPGPATPEAAAIAYLAALQAGDVAALHAAYITPAILAAFADCPKGTEGTEGTGQQDQQQILVEELAEADQILADTKLEVAAGAMLKPGAWEEENRVTTPAGTHQQSCTIRRDFEIANGALRWELTGADHLTSRKLASFVILHTDQSWHIVHAESF